MINSPTRAITIEQVLLQTLMLTPPYGHLGKPSSHSTCHGNQPRGYVNTGVLVCQNWMPNCRPLVHTHRTAEALVSNECLEDETAAAIELFSILSLDKPRYVSPFWS